MQESGKMEKRHLIFFILFYLTMTSQSLAQNCPVTKHQINHLKQALLCRSEESLTKCKQATGIGLSPEELLAAGIGENMGDEVSSKLWNDQIKLCRVPGFSFWFELFAPFSHAKTLECVTQDIYLGTLFDDVHKQVNENLMKNMEDVQKKPPEFLKDEVSFQKEIVSKQKNLQTLPENSYEYARNLSLKTAPLTKDEKISLLGLGLSESHLTAIENNRKLRAAAFENLQKVHYKHMVLAQKLQGKISLTPVEAKAYADFVKDLPTQNQPASLNQKINYFQFQVLTKFSAMADKASQLASASERAEKEALKKALEFIFPARIAARLTPIYGTYENAKSVTEFMGQVYDKIVPDASACSMTFSNYTRVDENCLPVKGNHSGVLEFLSQDWKTQQQALQSDTHLCENISAIYKEYTDPPYTVSCSENNFVAQTKNEFKLASLPNYLFPQIKIEGFKDKNGKLEKLVFEASRTNPTVVDNRTFAMTYQNGVMKELRYQKLPSSMAAKYNTAAVAGLNKSKWQREIASFSDEKYYLGYDVKEDLSDPEKPRGQKAISQVQNNNFYITEILGCCNKKSKLPGNLRCQAYGIHRGFLEMRQPAATPTR